MTPERFVGTLQALTFENAFNPYSERCLVHDCEDAPRRRSETLVSILHAASKAELQAIWLGRDLGFRGGRRTGLAFTDDVQLNAHGLRWGVDAERPTKGKAVVERSASVLWSILNRIEAPIFLWNVFPLHPHLAKEPFTNRRHNAQEQRAGEEILHELVGLLRPHRLVAIGNDAFATASRARPSGQVAKIRHPSYGGHTTFLRQVRELYTV